MSAPNPDSHLTMRALAVLAGRRPMRWVLKAGWYTQHTKPQLPKMPIGVRACFAEGGDVISWQSAKTVRPTCPACAVLADQAIDLAAERMAARIERRRQAAARREAE